MYIKLSIFCTAAHTDCIEFLRLRRLTEHDDPDVGHLTLFLFRDKWHIFFDFRYNKSKIKEIFEAGKEFFNAAKLALEKSMYRACVDSLYSAVELFATCQIYNMVGDEFQRKRRHRGNRLG